MCPALPASAGRASATTRSLSRNRRTVCQIRIQGLRARPTVALACYPSRADVVHTGEDKAPVFILADRGTGNRYVLLTKAADESMTRLLLAGRTEKWLTVYTDGVRTYEPLEGDDAFDRERELARTRPHHPYCRS